MSITDNYTAIRKEIPDDVTLVLACKKRTPEEVAEAIRAGATDLGENYVQEAEKMFDALGADALNVRWHMIGSLQKNKINKALRIVDVIQTVSSESQALAIDKRAEGMGKKVGIFIEVNIGEESAKAGIPPEYEAIEKLARAVSAMPSLKLEGLMTMGPFYGDPEALRPYFRQTRAIFDRIRALNLPGTEVKHLSMGMSDSYKVAIEEGSTMVRIGTSVFGPRPY